MRQRVTIAFGLLCSIAPPALAQPMARPPVSAQPEIFIPPADDDFNVKEVRRAMAKFADCVVKKHTPAAHKVVMEASVMRMSREGRQILDSNCLIRAVEDAGQEVTLETSPRAMKFALADALVRKNLSIFDPASISEAPPISQPTAPPSPEAIPAILAKAAPKERRKVEEGLAEYRAYVALNAMIECAVRANPQGARDLLDSRVASDQETKAIQAFMPAFSGCLNKGLQFKSDTTSLRGLVAVNFYRLAHASEVPVIVTRPEAAE